MIRVPLWSWIMAAAAVGLGALSAGPLDLPWSWTIVAAVGVALLLTLLGAAFASSAGRVQAQARKMTEELRASETRLAEAQSIAHVGSWEWDVQADSIAWSNEMYHIYGLDPESFQASFEAYLALVHIEDRPRVEAQIQHAFGSGEPFAFDHRFVRPDGSVRWMRSQGAVETGADGKPVRMHGTGQDITDRLFAEQKFEKLLEAAPDAMIIVDDKGQITIINAQAEKMFGYGREELIGRSIDMLVPEAARGQHGARREAYMHHPKPRPMGAGQSLTAVRKDGTEFPVEISLGPMRTDEGTFVTAAIRDITQREEAAAARQESVQKDLEIQQLREVSRFKTQLLNSAAHELNTPLTPIRLRMHMLKAGRYGDIKPEQQEAFDILDRNISRLESLTRDILDVARLEGGGLAMDPHPVKLGSLTRDVLDAFGDTAEAVGVTLQATGDLDAVVDTDSARMSQVFYNLVSNAIKFTPAGGTITIEARADGKHVAIRVEDTGVGLSDEQMARLFQPFSQVQDAEIQGSGGTGLGLYICKGIIEAMGTTITVTSAGPGKGSAFHFHLPVSSEEPEPEPEEKTGRVRPPADRTPVHPAAAKPQDPAEEGPESKENLSRRLRELI